MCIDALIQDFRKKLWNRGPDLSETQAKQRIEMVALNEWPLEQPLPCLFCFSTACNVFTIPLTAS